MVLLARGDRSHAASTASQTGLRVFGMSPIDERRLHSPTPAIVLHPISSGVTGLPCFGPDGTGAAAGILVQMAVDLVLILERDGGRSSSLTTCGSTSRLPG